MNKSNLQLNQIWLEHDKRIGALEKAYTLPSKVLQDVPHVEVDDIDSLNEIPKTGGVYWIWTNEPVRHKLHKNQIPDKFNEGSIIYNGVAKDNVRGRIYSHLFGSEESGWSAIGMDIFMKPSTSHRKKVMSTSKNNRVKVAYLLDGKRINSKDKLKMLHLNKTEKEYIDSTDQTEYYLRNGIDRRDEKHKSFTFIVYFIADLTSLTYLEFLEKRWRTSYGLPQLCSYTSGR